MVLPRLYGICNLLHRRGHNSPPFQSLPWPVVQPRVALVHYCTPSLWTILSARYFGRFDPLNRPVWWLATAA